MLLEQCLFGALSAPKPVSPTHDRTSRIASAFLPPGLQRRDRMRRLPESVEFATAAVKPGFHTCLVREVETQFIFEETVAWRR
jgi:hypothetical protein